MLAQRAQPVEWTLRWLDRCRWGTGDWRSAWCAAVAATADAKERERRKRCDPLCRPGLTYNPSLPPPPAQPRRAARWETRTPGRAARRQNRKAQASRSYIGCRSPHFDPAHSTDGSVASAASSQWGCRWHDKEDNRCLLRCASPEHRHAQRGVHAGRHSPRPRGRGERWRRTRCRSGLGTVRRHRR